MLGSNSNALPDTQDERVLEAVSDGAWQAFMHETPSAATHGGADAEADQRAYQVATAFEHLTDRMAQLEFMLGEVLNDPKQEVAQSADGLTGAGNFENVYFKSVRDSENPPQADAISAFDTLLNALNHRVGVMEGHQQTVLEQLGKIAQTIEASQTRVVQTDDAPFEMDEKISALETQVSAHLNHVDDSLTAQRERIEHLVQSVETRLTAPLPTPNLAPQREMLARFVTAMETIGTRAEQTNTAFESKLLGILSQLDARCATLEAMVAQASTPLELPPQVIASLRAIDAHMAKPPPSTDLAPQREMLARFTTAMATISQRHAQTTGALDAQIDQLRQRFDRHTERVQMMLERGLDHTALTQQVETVLQTVETLCAAAQPASEQTSSETLVAQVVEAIETACQRHDDASTRLGTQLAEVNNKLDDQKTQLEATTHEARLTQGAVSQNMLRLDQNHANLRDLIAQSTASADPSAFADQVLQTLTEQQASLSAEEIEERDLPDISEPLVRSLRFVVGEAMAQAWRDQRGD